MVISGGYSDPEPLTLHPVPEYNLHYFPRLCLQETPTVDMTEHDSTRPDFEDADPNRRTPLNDELTYAMECRAAREVFRNFEWSRDQAETWEDDVVGYQVTSSDEDDQEAVADQDQREGENEEDEMIDGHTLNWSVSEAAEQLEGVLGIEESEMPVLPGLGAQDFDSERGVTRPTSEGSIAPDLDPRSPAPVIDVAQGSGFLALEPPNENPSTEDLSQTVPEPSPAIEITSPPASPTTSLSLEPASSTAPQADRVPSPRLPSKSKSKSKFKLRLPSGLPASGLSSSEIVSIPSPDPNSPTRLVRRHPPGFGHVSKPSIDTISTIHQLGNHRLSVDLHGTISDLGDEDWEKLETDHDIGHGQGYSTIPSLSNTAPVAFFTRGFGTLRRRPSAINTNTNNNTGGGGGFRKHKNSESSNSQSGDGDGSNSSPTKSNRNRNRHRPIFNVKSIENTKKAFKTLKAFPRMISRSKDLPIAGPGATPGLAHSSVQTKSTVPSRVTTPTSPAQTVNGQSVPNTSTGSWFTTRRIGLSKSFAKPIRSTTPSSASTGSSSIGAYANDTVRIANSATKTKTQSKSKNEKESQNQDVPRVELTHSPPVDWDLGSEGMRLEIDMQQERGGGRQSVADGRDEGLVMSMKMDERPDEKNQNAQGAITTKES